MDCVERDAAGRDAFHTRQTIHGGHMYVIAIHSISDPQAFWGGQLDMPEGTTLPVAIPNTDGTRGVCIWESDSVDTVRNLVESAAGQVSTTDYFEVDAQNAQGLPTSALQA
jgi:hypothetical protein